MKLFFSFSPAAAASCAVYTYCFTLLTSILLVLYYCFDFVVVVFDDCFFLSSSFIVLFRYGVAYGSPPHSDFDKM